MTETEDKQLLRRLASERADAPLRELMDRYTAMVYGVCLRRTGNRELAEDATQAVFFLLFKKASSLVRHSSLAGWLYKCADSVARDAVRREARRLRYERSAAMSEAKYPQTPESIEPHLEEAMMRLSATDREAVVLRFLQDLSLAEVARQQRISEDAARMRVKRALDRLRGELSRAGVTATSESLGERLSEINPPLPPSLTGTLPSRVLRAQPSPAVKHLIKGAPPLMTPLSGIVAVSGLAVLFVSAPAVSRLGHVSPPPSLPGVPGAVPRTPGSAITPSLPASDPKAGPAMTSMIKALVGHWTGSLQGHGFDQPPPKIEFPDAEITYNVEKRMLSIRGRDADDAGQNADWEIDPSRGTILIGAADDSSLDIHHRFVSSSMAGKKGTLKFKLHNARMVGDLTVVYTDKHFEFDEHASVDVKGQTKRGEIKWVFDRAAAAP